MTHFFSSENNSKERESWSDEGIRRSELSFGIALRFGVQERNRDKMLMCWSLMEGYIEDRGSSAAHLPDLAVASIYDAGFVPGG